MAATNGSGYLYDGTKVDYQLGIGQATGNGPNGGTMAYVFQIGRQAEVFSSPPSPPRPEVPQPVYLPETNMETDFADQIGAPTAPSTNIFDGIGSFISGAADVAGKVAGVVNAFKGAPESQKQQLAATQVQSGGFGGMETKTLWIIGGGAALLLVVGGFFLLRRKSR